MIRACLRGDIDGAMEKLNELWNQGYSAVDIVVTIFRVVKTFDEYVVLFSSTEFVSNIVNLVVQNAGVYET